MIDLEMSQSMSNQISTKENLNLLKEFQEYLISEKNFSKNSLL